MNDKKRVLAKALLVDKTLGKSITAMPNNMFYHLQVLICGFSSTMTKCFLCYGITIIKRTLKSSYLWPFDDVYAEANIILVTSGLKFL